MPKRKIYEFQHIFDSKHYRSEVLATAVESHLDKLQGIYDRTLARIAQIRANRGLNVVGKKEAFAALKKDIGKELTEWGTFQQHYTSQIERLEKEAQPKRHPKDDAVFELRQREVRDYLRTLEPTELEARVRAAAETGEDELIHAVKHSPVPMRLATEGLIDQISHQLWARQFPGDADSLRDLRRAREETTSAFSSVCTKCRRRYVPDFLLLSSLHSI